MIWFAAAKTVSVEELESSNKYSFSANFHVLSCNAVIVLPQNTELIRDAE